MDFLPNDAKNKLHTPSLKVDVVLIQSVEKAL